MSINTREHKPCLLSRSRSRYMGCQWRFLVSLVALASTVGCGRHPSPIRTAQDIGATPADIEEAHIGFLPISDYPKLVKFKELRTIDFFLVEGSGANDAKLEALSKIELNSLRCVQLLKCKEVTNVGISYLAKHKSIRQLQLIGTSITDEACDVIVEEMTVTGITVGKCPDITMKGLHRLATSSNLVELGFSAESLDQDEIIQLIGGFINIRHCTIIDDENKLNKDRVLQVGEQKGAKVVVMSCPAQWK